MLFGSAARANSGFKPVLLSHSCYPLFISIRFASANAISDRFELSFGECFIDSFYPTRKTAYWARLNTRPNFCTTAGLIKQSK